MVLGKHSGRHAFEARTRQLGFSLSPEEINKAFVRFKNLADQKKTVSDFDIEALVHTQVVLFQLVIKEAGIPPEVMVSHLAALAESEETPANVRTLLNLHGDACNAAVAEDEVTSHKKRPDWYQGIIDGDDSPSQEHPKEETEESPDQNTKPGAE